MLNSRYECYFEPETLAAIRDLFGDDSDAYARALRGDAHGLMVKLRRASWPRTLHINPERAAEILADPTVFAAMIDKAKKATKLAEVVDREWLSKCPLEEATRAARKRRAEQEAQWFAM